jgi:hypothetical protein
MPKTWSLNPEFDIVASPTDPNAPRSSFRDAVQQLHGHEAQQEWILSGITESQAHSEPILSGRDGNHYMNASWISSSNSVAA